MQDTDSAGTRSARAPPGHVTEAQQLETWEDEGGQPELSKEIANETETRCAPQGWISGRSVARVSSTAAAHSRIREIE
jgi:hypothetical protein